MKRLYYIICATVLVLCASSCEKFLTENSQSSLTPENSFTTADDWNKVLTASYSMLQLVFAEKYTITLNEFGTDEVEPFDLGWAAYAELKHYTFSASHEFFRVHYIWSYDGIKRANTIIDMPETAPVSDEERRLMVAQAKFLRSIFYFDLVAMYGGVPIWKQASVDSDEISKPRATAEQVYNLIFEDMKYAAANLPETWPEAKDKGRATSHAANALLGRFYLQAGKPAEALTALNKVIGKFHLYDKYEDIFSPYHKNEEYENIFEIQFSHSGAWGLEGSIQSSYWGPRGGGGPTDNAFGWGGFGPSQYLYDQYDPSDKRRTAFFCTEYRGVPQNPPCIMKFRDPDYGNQIEDDDLNFIVMRYPDVLLMKAEALNAMGDTSNDKYDCINQVRQRAGITPLSGLTQEEFAAAVLKERLLELCCEHHRRFDLLRFGKLKEAVKAAHNIDIQDYHVLYPIPQQAIDNNEAMSAADQNPGY